LGWDGFVVGYVTEYPQCIQVDGHAAAFDGAARAEGVPHLLMGVPRRVDVDVVHVDKTIERRAESSIVSSANSRAAYRIEGMN